MKIERLLKYMFGKKIYKMILSFTMMLMLFAHPQPVAAASSAIVASTDTIMVKEHVTRYANVFGNHRYTMHETMSSADPSMLSRSGSLWKKVNVISEPEGFATSVTFTANRSGTACITFTPSSGNIDGDERDIATAIMTDTVIDADTELSQDENPEKTEPDIFISYKGEQLGVVRTLDVQVPDTFKAKKITLHDQEVMAYHSSLMNLYIIYMIDEANRKNWYLYDPESETITSVYEPILLLGRNLAIVNVPEALQSRTGMSYGPVEIAEQMMMGWTFDDPAFVNYALVYLMDDQGTMQYYLYEQSERIMQLYSNQAAVTQADYEASITAVAQRMIMILALLITNIITMMLLIFVMVKKRKRRIIDMQELERFERMLYREVEFDDITDFLLKS